MIIYRLKNGSVFLKSFEKWKFPKNRLKISQIQKIHSKVWLGFQANVYMLSGPEGVWICVLLIAQLSKHK